MLFSSNPGSFGIDELSEVNLLTQILDTWKDLGYGKLRNWSRCCFWICFAVFFLCSFFLWTTKTMSKISGQLLDCRRGLCWEILYLEYRDTSLNQTHRDSASKGRNTKAGSKIYTPWNSHIFCCPWKIGGLFFPQKGKGHVIFEASIFGWQGCSAEVTGENELLPLDRFLEPRHSKPPKRWGW